MSLVIFEGAAFDGEKIAINASSIIGVISNEVKDDASTSVIMFRSGDTDHRAVVKHTVEDIVAALNKVWGGF